MLLGLAVDSGRLLGLGQLPSDRLLALVVRSALDLPALLKTIGISNLSKGNLNGMGIPSNNILVLPAELVSETANSAVLAAGLQPQYAQRLGNDDALLLVVRSGDTLESLQALESGLTAGGLVRNHAADGTPEHLGGGAEVEGTWDD